MTLSELKINEIAYIAKIKGVGAFQKRISEMGFVKGQKVRSVKPAPFKGPIQYEIMGYKISLRKPEADLIEIVKINPLKDNETGLPGISEESIQKVLEKKSKTINVALVGNPNSGKTSIFNFASNSKEKVGNYSGVTVSTKTAVFRHNGYTFNITDLPGTYSLTEYTPEEKCVRKHLTENIPDVIVNIVDASNLERNLFLTSQLIDMDVKVVLALNMFDELQIENIKFDYQNGAELMGIPIIPTIGQTGEGVTDLFEEVIKTYEGQEELARHIHIDYGQDIELSIKRLRTELNKISSINSRISGRYWALKLLEENRDICHELDKSDVYDDLLKITKQEIKRIVKKYKEDPQSLITASKYGFISGVLIETFPTKPKLKQTIAEKIDNFLLHKYFSLPIFLTFMFLMFWTSFNLGQYPTDLISEGVELLRVTLTGIMPPCTFTDFIIDGIIPGVGGVLIFVPNIIILFAFISFMEDSGYMSRASFIMDKFMHTVGLHGQSFIPLLIGFGCNVPAIMAARTIRSKRDRILTILMIPFMSCSARFPVFILLSAAFFPSSPALFIFGLYIFGIFISIIVAKFLKLTMFKKQDTPFVLELPPYRIPSLKSVLLDMWEKTLFYLQKIAKVIIVASALIWFLVNYPKVDFGDEPINNAVQIENSFLGKTGKVLTPIVEPLGFDWKMTVSLIAGVVAKEIIVSSMNIIYESEDGKLSETLKSDRAFTSPIALSFIVFILLYLPCISVITTIYKEAGYKIMLLSIFINTSVAWLAAFGVYHIFNWIL